jgi:predicted MFS family arabinose efflux permease
MTNRLKRTFKSEDFLVFLFTMFLFGTATGLFAGVLNNFLAEILYIDRFGRGVVEFLREVPGLSLILLLALMYRFSETQIIRVALLVSLFGLIGLFLTGPNRVLGVVFIMMWSMGEHLFMPVRHSIAIHSARPGKAGRAMGITGGFGNFGEVAGFYMVPIIFFIVKWLFPETEVSSGLTGAPDAEPAAGTETGAGASVLPFRVVFLTATVFLIAGLVLSLKFRRSDRSVKKERLYFRKKYWRDYIIGMFFGGRKQVFLTFAPFVLILNYGASTELIATLYGVYATSNIFVHPLVGRLMDRIGPKTILVADASLLITICLLYGFAHHLFPAGTAYIVVCIVFVLDGILFVVAMARAMYAKTLSSDQNELTATLSTGISINHLISIIIALLGGLLWQHLGTELLFIFAACFAVGALIFSSLLPKRAGPE